MSSGFFSNFPLIKYNGQNVVDITKSLSLFPESVASSIPFQSYVLNETIRSDQLSENIYQNPYLEWLIFLSNQKIDPYQWYMDQSQFNYFVNEKYGDYIGVAQTRVKYYTNNWYNQDILTTGGFNALPPELKKYYQPSYNSSCNIIQYVRTQENWPIVTNHLMNITFSNSVHNISRFIIDEPITIQWDIGQIGTGQVAFCSNNQLSYQHVSGYYYPASNNIANINAAAFYILGSNSGIFITTSNSNNILSVYGYDTLKPDEYIYYDPVTYYDYENLKNENNKDINLLDASLAPQVTTAVKTIFQ